MISAKQIRMVASATVLAGGLMLNAPKRASAAEPCTCEESAGFIGDTQAYCAQFNGGGSYWCADDFTCMKTWNGMFWEYEYHTWCYEQTTECVYMPVYC